MTLDILKATKIAKAIVYGLMIAFVAVFITLCIAVGAKNKKIKEYKEGVAYQTELIAKANAKADSLAKLECVSISNTIVINQKGLVNTTQANQISKSIATYTRQEILEALDSLRIANNKM